MSDPRTERLATVLVQYSAALRPGDRVLIEAETAAEPLVRALFERALQAGAHPHLALSLAGQDTYTGIDDALLRPQMERGGRGEFRWVTTIFPTIGHAHDAEMSLTEFEDYVFGACHVAGEDDPVAYWQAGEEGPAPWG